MRIWLGPSIMVLAALGCSARPQPHSPSPTTGEMPGTVAMPNDAAPPPPLAATSIQPTAGASGIDMLFTQFAQKLPEPATLSEQNGATATCSHGYATYTLLYATAQKIPVESHTDLRLVVPWARHSDPCIRQIAIEVLLAKLGNDRNALSLPSMHEPEHYQFHAIHTALKARLDGQRLAYTAGDFGELLFIVEPTRAVEYLVGGWTEPVDASAGEQTLLAVTPQASTVTSRRLPVDARFADMVYTATFKGLALVDGHFVAKGEPVQQFWPVTQNIMWYRAGSPYWVKLRRNAPR